MDFQNKTHVLYFLFVTALILVRIPFIGKAVKVFYTLIHELGHAIMTVITSGEIISISLFSDTSGNTISKSKGKFGQFLIAIAGYPMAAMLAFIFFYLLHQGKTTLVLYIFAGMALVELIFWIRNLYGIIWIVSFLILLVLIYRANVEMYSYAFCVFFSSVLLIESFISGIELVYYSFRNPSNAGDASNLKKLSYIPAFTWALLFLSLSVFFIYHIVKIYFSI